MLTFDNPGHREALQRLGLLPEGQAHVDSHQLAHKAIENRKVEDVVYLLRQELATYATNFSLLDHTLKRAKRQAEAIIDHATLEKAQETLRHILTLLQQTTEQAELIHICVQTIETAIDSDPTLVDLLTPTLEEHFRSIYALTGTMPEAVRQQLPRIVEHLAEIEAEIERKRQELD